LRTEFNDSAVESDSSDVASDPIVFDAIRLATLARAHFATGYAALGAGDFAEPVDQGFGRKRQRRHFLQ